MPTALPKFTGILFDLDDTLNDRTASWAAFVPLLIGEYHDRLLSQEVAPIHAAIVRADRGGYRPKDAFVAELRERLPWKDAPTARELEIFWKAHFAHCTIERPGAKRLLRDLRRAGFRLGIVTNGHTDMQSAKLKCLELDDLVDAVVVSECVGVKKPHPRIFEEALRVVGCERHQAGFVGDSPLLDVAGASKAGMRTIWLRLGRAWPEHPFTPDYSIETLDELREIVGLAE